MTSKATLVGKYIPEKLKNKSIEDLQIILNKYEDEQELESKKKDLLTEATKQNNIDEKKNLAINSFNQMKKRDNAKISFQRWKLFLNIFTGFFSKLWDGIKQILASRSVVLQYLIMIFIVVMFIVWFYGGFSNKKNIITNTKANNPTDVINANNIYKQNNNGFLSKIIPKNMYYYIADFNNSFNKIFYNKDIILSNSSDRTTDNENGRHDHMLTGNKAGDSNKIENYLKPNNIEWELPENSYINSDFNKLPDYIKNYDDNGHMISLNNKKIIVFPYIEDSTGIYLLGDPVYKYNNAKDSSIPIGNLLFTNHAATKEKESYIDDYRYEIKTSNN